ncbi:MAG: hypothetical protein NC915_03570 [Candidatus Omnitrophica bacterium]|nr:hypothetical protein [Candidatus Omnitrophota bacterium]
MKILFKIYFLFFLICLYLFSDEIKLTELEKEVTIKSGEQLTLSFKLPEVKNAKLYFLARTGDEALEGPAGYADALLIEINNKRITDPTKLINKPPIFKLKGKPEKEIQWYNNNSWMIPISPDYISVDFHYLYAPIDKETSKEVKGCEFVFDITEFVIEGENKLKLIRLPRPWSKIPIHFKNIKVIYEKGMNPFKKEAQQQKNLIIAKEEKIPAGEKKIFTLPLKEENKTYFLKITVRRQSERMAGYGYYMQILLNDKYIDASIDRKTKRLVDKPFSFTRKTGEAFFNLGDGIWLTFFVPDFYTDVSSYTGGAVKDPFTYTLDITDLLNETGKNQLSIRNLCSKVKEVDSKMELSLYVNVEVVVKEFQDDRKLKKEEVELKGTPYLELTKTGGIKLNFDNASLILESIFSYPEGGFNKLGKELSVDGEKDWKLEVKKNIKNEVEIFAKGKFYSINRKAKLSQNKILIEDEIVNLTSEDLGIIFSNYINFENFPIYFTRMAGSSSQTVNNLNAPYNPTIFYPLKNSGIGIVANDDVYRNQGILFYDLDKKITGIRDENFCLGPKKSYKFSWSVYFLSSDDYYDFINLVRNDWGSNNITINGPIYFINYGGVLNMSEEELMKWIKHKNAKYISFWEIRTPNPIPEYDNRRVVAYGPGIFNPIFKEEIEKVKRAVAKLRKINNNLKITLYTHCFFISPEKPDDPTYKDSWIVDKEGKRAVSQYNNPTYYDYQPVFPTLTNSYGKAFSKVIDFYLNDLDFDWIYWDESTGPGIFGESDRTYNAWDGYSAIINPETKKIEKKFGLLVLLSDDFIMSMYKKVKDKGGFVLFNSAARTKSRINTASFVESQDLILRAYDTHLNTPLAYGYGKPSMNELIERLNYGTIYARTHIDYVSDIVTKFYPITIEEIHSGWVKGKERIITAKSGQYGWDGKYKAKIYIYNENGECINSNSPVNSYENKIKIDVPSGGIVIIEKIQ